MIGIDRVAETGDSQYQREKDRHDEGEFDDGVSAVPLQLL
jgi:hypothetical protein